MPGAQSLRWIMACALLGCAAPVEPAVHTASTAPEPYRPPPASPASPPSPAPQVETPQEAPPSDPPLPPLTLITDRDVLSRLQGRGLSFAQLVLGRDDAPLSALSDHPRMRSIYAELKRDLARISARDPRAGVGMRHVHRLFDLRWLRSGHTRFQLVGVVNRIDRAAVLPAHCGETRLIYRLAYATDVTSSRLPMTVNVVFFQPRDGGQGCTPAAQRWQAPADGAALAEHLVGEAGPLAPKRLTVSRFHAVELNVQTVRWPSTIRPDMGGHAQYALRVMVPHEGGLRAGPLENTPRSRLGPGARAELLAWIGQHLDGIDAGTAVMPAQFSATVSSSVTPLGLGRLHNRPFAAHFSADDFAALPLAGRQHIASPQALLRRLDGMSCAGCHQTRSAAGFHLLGEDDPARTLDAVRVPASPHLLGELPRRRAYAQAVANGEAPQPGRPHSDHELGFGGWGSHCGLGDPGFAAWTCAPGLRCAQHGDPHVGTCVTDGPGGAGDACEVGTLRAHRDPMRDKVRGHGAQGCRSGVCNDNRVGFPHGMCADDCDGLREHEACGAIVSLRPFNDCIARGDPFAGCITSAAFPAGMRACDAEHACRDDYLCARTSEVRGVCIPPYFLFQLRVDGHVVPD